MTNDALDMLRELVAAIERAECADAEHFELDAIDAELDRARALLAAQEPRPEPTANEDAHWLRCWGDDEMARGNVSNAQRFIEIADRLGSAATPRPD